MRRGARAGTALWLLLAAAFPFAPAVRGGGEDPPPAALPAPRPLADVALAPFEGDPTGEATAADARARAFLAPASGRAADPAAAARAWMDLAEDGSAGLLETPPVPYGARGLWWPAREVALLRLAALPAAGRAAVEARWGARAAALLAEAAAGGDETTLSRAAEAGPCTHAGGEALLLLAERDLERGEATRAAARLARWVRLFPSEPPARRAAVGARLLDARALAHDAVGAIGDFRALLDVALLPVRRGGVEVALHDVAEAAFSRAHALAAAPPRATEPRAPELPAAPEALWSLSLVDAPPLEEPVFDPFALMSISPDAPPTRPAQVSVAAGAVWLAGPHSVRRVAPATGLVVWRFPAAPPSRAREAAYASSMQLPARGVAVADGRVYAVLGDPAGSSSGPPRARRIGLGGDDGRESRARLVALDASSGRLLWFTGAPSETHPVLRARDVSVSSPPTADGDRVWVTLSARRGAVECWLASFDAATGAARTVTYLGRGEDGLEGPAQARGFRGPWRSEATTPAGEPPVRAGEEVCTAPGAGFAAGVRAEDGRLLWVQALPAFEWAAPSGPPWAMQRSREEPRAHAVDNVPVFGHGSWFVAAAGSPAPAALETGTGRLRWVGAREYAALAPPARVAAPYLLYAAADAGGVPRLLLGGGEKGLLRYDAESGRLDDLGLLPFESKNPAGRPWVGDGPSGGDGTVVLLKDNRPRVVRLGPAGAVESVPAAGVPRPNPWPSEGDLLRAGDMWLVVSGARVTAIASGTAAAEIASAAALDPRDRAVRALLAFKRAPSLDALDRAAAAAGSSGDADAVAGFSDAVEEALGKAVALRKEVATGAGVRRAAIAFDRLAAADRSPCYLALARLLKGASGGAEPLVELCVRWIAFGRAGECTPDPTSYRTQRGDLAARDLLREAVAEPPGAAACAAAERDSVAAAAASPGPAGAPPEPWTAAAWAGLAARLGAAIDAGRFAEAAALAADLRLAPPVLSRVDPACAQALRAIEADAVARAGEVDAARDRLHDALAADAGAARGAFGAPGASVAAALAAEAGLVPALPPGLPETLELEPDAPGAAPAAEDRLRPAPFVLEPAGPGATRTLSRAVVAREGGLEVLDLATRTRVGTSPAHVGDIGVELLDAEEFVPGAGALVVSVAVRSPADVSGLRDGDWVVGWDGAPVADREDLEHRIATTPPGRRVDALVLRDGRERVVPIVVAARVGPPDAGPVFPRAWMRTQDEAVVLQPFGLEVVDLKDARVKPLWGAGDGPAAASFTGFSDVLYVLRGVHDFDACSLVAVDAASGRERWSVPLEGPAKGEPRVVGSAVVVDVVAPQRTVVFDAATGERRGGFARARAYFGWQRSIRNLNNAVGRAAADSSDAAGLTILLAHDPPPPPEATPPARTRRGARGTLTPISVVAANPTTGGVAWAHRPNPDEQDRAYFSLFDAGGVAALAVSSQRIDVYVPDLVGGLVRGQPVAVPADKFGVNQTALEIRQNTRLVVRGDVVHIVRSTEAGVSVAAVEIEREGLSPWRSLDPVVWHPTQTAFGATVGASIQGKRPWQQPVAVSWRATLEGLWVLSSFANFEAEENPGRATWYEPLRDDKLTPFATEGTAPPSGRAGIVTVGSVALVPTEKGFLRIPLAPVPSPGNR